MYPKPKTTNQVIPVKTWQLFPYPNWSQDEPLKPKDDINITQIKGIKFCMALVESLQPKMEVIPCDHKSNADVGNLLVRHGHVELLQSNSGYKNPNPVPKKKSKLSKNHTRPPSD